VQKFSTALTSQMSKYLLLVIVLVLLRIADTADGVLIDNLDGTITDTDFDIMWLKNANLAGIAMTWDEAVSWAENLISAGYNDWRLPTALNYDGSGPEGGFNLTGTEMGHLYYDELSNPAHGPLVNTGPFINVPESVPPCYGRYWLGEEIYPFSAGAWMFGFTNGSQGINAKTQAAHAWAVRTIPEPATICVLGLGALVLRKRTILGRNKQKG